jgi:hypothetical protein
MLASTTKAPPHAGRHLGASGLGGEGPRGSVTRTVSVPKALMGLRCIIVMVVVVRVVVVLVMILDMTAAFS